jgi:phosphoribosylanthranilate isomerase
VSIAEAREVLRATAPLVTTVGLFVDATQEEVSRVLDSCDLDCLQFHGSEDSAFCTQFSRPYLRVVSMRPDVDVASVVDDHPAARAFLFDAWRDDAPGGTGDTFPWERIPRMNRPWILAGGLNASNIATAIRERRPPAVDVSGGVECEPGVKDESKVREFISAVRSAERLMQSFHEDAAE